MRRIGKLYLEQPSETVLNIGLNIGLNSVTDDKPCHFGDFL